ncbi:MAG: hypothetical protein KGL39_13180 [Patescibacteria group bacterium]|nr:hypothetical protein [Patescibacteria group bacterium]
MTPANQSLHAMPDTPVTSAGNAGIMGGVSVMRELCVRRNRVAEVFLDVINVATQFSQFDSDLPEFVFEHAQFQTEQAHWSTIGLAPSSFDDVWIFVRLAHIFGFC